MNRHESKRFKFDCESYPNKIDGGMTKHIKIYPEGAMQVELWLTEEDKRILLQALEDDKDFRNDDI